MVDITRPEYGTVWASEGEKLSPAQDKIKLGWVQEMMPFQWENFLQARQDEAITYLLQKGIPEYSATQEYIAQKSVVLYQGAVYLATQTVTNVLPSVAASWKRVSTISDASGIVSVAGGGTGATTAAQARTNLGLGTASTLNTDVVVQKDESGNFSAGVITASLAGNATSADKLKTARTLQVAGVLTSTPTPFDGTSNVSIPVTSIDADGLTTGTVPAAVLGNAITKTSLTGSALLPAGSTEQRDVPAQEAYFRYNKTTKLPEFYDGVGWKSITGLNTGNFVEKTSSVGVAVLPEGDDSARPAEIPTNGGLTRANNAVGDYFLEFRNRLSNAWDAIASREWVSSAISTAINALNKITGSGSAPYFGVRAFVNFNGTGVVAVRSAGNVSSVTDVAVGKYTINFNTPVPANAAVFWFGADGTDVTGSTYIGLKLMDQSTTSVTVGFTNSFGSGGPADVLYGNLIIVG